jgi:lipopolysaccharide biosynthesis regulator YciM
MALMAKRSGETEKAEALWQELAHDPKEGSEACEQLAIYYERQAKDLQRALEFAQLGLMKLERQGWASRDPIWHARKARHQEKLMCRVDRLRHRIDRNNAATRAPLLAKPATAGGGV